MSGGEDIRFRPFDLGADVEPLHDWVRREYATFWGLRGASVEQVRNEYERLLAREGYEIFVGERDGQPVVLLECYPPSLDDVGETYPVQPGDVGAHVLVAPRPVSPRRNFTWHVFRAVFEFMFEDPKATRILVEPDLRNKKMFSLCQRVGFRLGPVVELPHKTAQLAFLTRERFGNVTHHPDPPPRGTVNQIDTIVSPRDSVAHLTPERWAAANRHLLAKAITEFSHERLLKPSMVEEGASGWDLFELRTPGPTYRFRAQRLPLEHLLVAPESLCDDTGVDDVDVVSFIGHVRAELGLRPDQLPLYIEEVLSTLHGHAYKAARSTPTARALARSDFQTIEQAMTEGHPCFIANNGRIGFDAGDYRAYAPEAGSSFCLMWLAGHHSRTEYAGMDDLPYETLIAEELDAQTRARFEQAIRDRGKDPADYRLIPVHPWQWFNKLANVFASEIATGYLLCLGYGPDQYLAQQSVRTMFNVTEPTKRYVKSALSILNMGFMRGLPRYYLGSAPPMARWLEDRLYADPYLRASGFRMLSEVAAVSYENPYFAEFGPHDDYNKMLASLWRESPMTQVGPSEQAMTMAALLHVDDQGALLSALVERSGLSAEAWLDAYLEAYLSPLLHCFFAHDLVFMPHGENIILVLDEGVPRRVFIKDITEEAAILSADVELPENLERMRVVVDDDMRPLSIFIDIFDDFFRPLSAVVQAHTDLSAEEFWGRVAHCVKRYQNAHPHDATKHRRFDLFKPTFELSCLNRLQLRNHRRLLDLDEPTGALQFAGPIPNPLAAHR